VEERGAEIKSSRGEEALIADVDSLFARGRVLRILSVCRCIGSRNGESICVCLANKYVYNLDKTPERIASFRKTSGLLFLLSRPGQ